AGWPTQVVMPSFMPKGANNVPFDQFSIWGADHWYNVGAQRVRALLNDLANRAFRPGYLRSVGSGWTNWAVESFMDEAAHAAGIDPVAFRLRLLDGAGRNAGTAPDSVGGARRQAAVVKRAAEKGGWGSTMPKDTGLGMATTFGQERTMPTWSACVARVRVDRGHGNVILGRRRRDNRPSGRGAGASRRRCVVGCEPSVARRLGICERPREGHQSRHLYATAYGRRAGDGHRIPAQHRGADGPWRACYHRCRPGDRKRHICRARCAPAPLANPAGCGSAGSQPKELITWAARRRFKA